MLYFTGKQQKKKKKVLNQASLCQVFTLYFFQLTEVKIDYKFKNNPGYFHCYPTQKTLSFG